MAASRRGPPPLSVRLPQPLSAVNVPDLPPISALFLIDFDVKAGYTIVWKQAVPGLELEGIVEYKSLPSGLHTVSDDLIYFVHGGGHAGLSAFVNTPTDEEEMRHARMIAVGVLVPLSYGRLGRAWRHVEGLREIAAKLAADRKQTRLLEEYWDKNGLRDTAAPQPLNDTPLESPLFSIKARRPGLGKRHARSRSASDGTALIPPGHSLSPFHPAWSLTSLLDTFGPLIFPIHRAALLRKRILISCHTPVHEVCNFVYNISVLSNIPLSVCDVIDPSAPVQRLRPLFTIGVHDISYLLEHQAALKRTDRGHDLENPSNIDDTSSGWVACTTDSILAMKETLWDMLITMPPPYSSNAKQRVWPTVECPKGVPVKATQRDLRRFRSLSVGLARLAPAQGQRQAHNQSRSPRSEASDSPALTTTTTAPSAAIRLSKPASGSRPGTAAAEGHRPPTKTLLHTTLSSAAAAAASPTSDDTDTIVEPTTWAALAYNGFMWWASAGEKRHSDEVDELNRDAALLADLVPAPAPASPALGGSSLLSQRMGSAGRKGRRVSTGSSVGRDKNGVGSVVSGAASGSRSARRLGEGEGEGGGDAAANDDDDDDDDDVRVEDQGRHGDDEDDDDDSAQARVELAVVAYFHRLTTSALSVLADIVDSSDEDDLLDLGVGFDGSGLQRGGGEEEEARLLMGGAAGNGSGSGSKGWVRVDSEALAEMGLDVWSQADADFVRELSVRYFSRRAHVETKGVEVCGVRVC